MNVFSSFNPMNFIFFSWFLINFLFIFNNVILLNFKKNTKFFFFYKKIFNFLKNDFCNLNNSLLSLNLLIYFFIFNMILNLINLIPFSFCQNSQLNLFFFISLTFWISCVMYSFYYFFKKSFSHLTPMGCPLLMSFFMVLIEMISLLIRPITLSVRMSANLLAGHLLIHLLTEFFFFLNKKFFFSSLILIILFLILIILEICVSIIQSYIFFNLINMYSNENKN